MAPLGGHEVLVEHFRNLTSRIAADGRIAGETGHAVTTGSLREGIVRKFLKPHLPKQFDIKSGIIIDSQGHRSAQQDCIIIDTRLPTIDLGSDTHGIFLAESVIATIEVKSDLTSDELRGTMESIAKTNKLKRNGFLWYRKGPVAMQFQTPVPILSYIIAYDGATLETLSNAAIAVANERQDGGLVPDGICVLTKGVILRSPLRPVVRGNNVQLPAIRECTLQGTHLPQDALFVFFQRLLDDVMPLQMENLDLDSYFTVPEPSTEPANKNGDQS